MLEIGSAFRQSMVPFCTGSIGAEVLASLGAQPLDPLLASAPRDPPAPSGPPKGMNGEYIIIIHWPQAESLKKYIYIYLLYFNAVNNVQINEYMCQV